MPTSATALSVPGAEFLQGPDEVTGGDMVAAMDAVGVDGALLVSPFSMYRYDASYALEVYGKHPGRFGLIKPFDPQSEATADEMAEWTGTPGVVGARIMLVGQAFEADDPGLESHTSCRRPCRRSGECHGFGPAALTARVGSPPSGYPSGG